MTWILYIKLMDLKGEEVTNSKTMSKMSKKREAIRVGQEQCSGSRLLNSTTLAAMMAELLNQCVKEG